MVGGVDSLPASKGGLDTTAEISTLAVELVHPVFECETKVPPVTWVNGDCKEGILQIYFCQPISGLQQILQCVDSFHLEVLSPYKLVEGFQVDDKSLSPILLWNQEEGGVEPCRGSGQLYYSSFPEQLSELRPDQLSLIV